MVTIYSHYVRPERAYQPHDPTELVEKTGYVSAKDRIEAIMAAGARLIQHRAEQYDFREDEVDEEFYDPTRKKGYDMADAFQDSIALSARLKEQKERKSADDKKSAIEKPQDERSEVLKDEKK